MLARARHTAWLATTGTRGNQGVEPRWPAFRRYVSRGMRIWTPVVKCLDRWQSIADALIPLAHAGALTPGLSWLKISSLTCFGVRQDFPPASLCARRFSCYLLIWAPVPVDISSLAQSARSFVRRPTEGFGGIPTSLPSDGCSSATPHSVLERRVPSLAWKQPRPLPVVYNGHDAPTIQADVVHLSREIRQYQSNQGCLGSAEV